MHKLLDRIKERLAAFAAQRDDFTLVVRAGQSSVPPLLKIVEGLDETSGSEMFWTCTEDFNSPAGYVSAVVKWFGTLHQATRLLMQQKGMAPWPELPGSVLSEETPPARRLQELMIFSRSLPPVREGCVVVWTFFPTQVLAPSAYADLFAQVVRHDFPSPWCHHIRILLRDDPADGTLSKRLASSPRVDWYDADLSPEAIESGLEEELGDESVPLADRMTLLMVNAGMDYRHGRWAQALEKFQLAADYHGTIGNLSVAAVAFNSMGEANLQLGQEDKAEECFRAALVPLTMLKDPPAVVYLAVLVNLGNLCFNQRRWEEAEGYYECAHVMASLARTAPIKLNCIEQKGVAQYRQDKVEDALETWRFGAEIAGKVGEKEAQRSLLERIQDHYQTTRDKGKLSELQEQLAAL